MDTTAISLSVILMLVLTLLLISLIYSKIHWGFKSLIIISSLSAACLSFFVFQASLGWPVKRLAPPPVFEFIHGYVEEPIGTKEGAIFLWVNLPKSRIPLSIKLPYSKPLHKKVQQANQKASKGESVHMETKLNKGDFDARKGKSKNDQHTDEMESPIDFIPPPDTVPSKTD